jgi:hypothetical protein
VLCVLGVINTKFALNVPNRNSENVRLHWIDFFSLRSIISAAAIYFIPENSLLQYVFCLREVCQIETQSVYSVLVHLQTALRVLYVVYRVYFYTGKTDQQICMLFTIICLYQCHRCMFRWSSRHHQGAARVTGSVLHLKSYNISLKKPPLDVSAVKPPSAACIKGHTLRSASKVIQYFI